MGTKLKNGDLDDLVISIDITESQLDSNANFPPEMANMQESFVKIIGLASKKVQKDFKVKDAKVALRNEAAEKILDMDSIKREALKKAENEGIIFIDEIDKVATNGSNSRQDPSKEGVQRDLLPIIEGSSVNTKLGILNTDHVLFIAAGAFHVSKPSDLIPELQGRFPLRVELDSLDENALYEILIKSKNSLLKQYADLLSTEGVELKFSDESIKEIAHLSALANEKVEDIGARRLHTVIEKLLEDINYEAENWAGKCVEIDKKMVNEKLDFAVNDEDIAKFIL